MFSSAHRLNHTKDIAMKMQPEKNYGVIKYSRTFTILIEFSKFHQMLLLLRITQQLHVNVLQCTTRGFVD